MGDGFREDYPKIPPTPVAITRYFNVYTAKVVALVLVIGFILFHGMFHLKYGESRLRGVSQSHNIIIVFFPRSMPFETKCTLLACVLSVWQGQ